MEGDVERIRGLMWHIAVCRNLGGTGAACPSHPVMESTVTGTPVVMSMQPNDRDYDDGN